MRRKMSSQGLPQRVKSGEYGVYLQHPMSANERAKTIGQKLREYRLRADISQKELCQILDCAPQTYSTYESGQHEPRLEVLVRLSYLYDVPVDWLMGKNRSDDVDLSTNEEADYLAYLENQDQQHALDENKRLDELSGNDKRIAEKVFEMVIAKMTK